MNEVKRSVFLAVVCVLSCVIVLCVVAYFSPFKMVFSSSVDSIADEVSNIIDANEEIVICYQELGRLPSDAQGVKVLQKSRIARDKMMKYVRIGEFEYMIVSCGGDGKRGTLDDVKCVFDIRKSPYDFSFGDY